MNKETQTKELYQPFGDEWVKEVMKMPKKRIIEHFLRPALQKVSVLNKAASPLPSSTQEVKTAEEILNDHGLNRMLFETGPYAAIIESMEAYANQYRSLHNTK